MLENTRSNMAKMWEGIKSNKLIKAETENLTSVRTKLTYFLALTWVGVNSLILSNIFEAVKLVDPSSKILLLDKTISIFYVDSFVFIMMLLVYVLKRQRIIFKAWGIELNIEENKTNIKSNEVPEVTDAK